MLFDKLKHLNPIIPIHWKEERIRLEQKLCKNEDIIQDLNDTLNALKINANKNNWFAPICFISYAWPHPQFQEEIWIQSFIEDLNQHLRVAGITTLLDRKNNRIGGSVYSFVEEIEKSHDVIIVGSQSLLLKHKIGKSTICSELNKIREKRKKNIFPILLNGDVKTAFPEWFEGYTNIVDWRDDSYIINLKELLRGLYKIDPYDVAFNNIWQALEVKHPDLVKGIPKEVLFTLKEKENILLENELTQSYHYFSEKLDESMSTPFLNLLDDRQDEVSKVQYWQQKIFNPSFLKYSVFFILFVLIVTNHTSIQNYFNIRKNHVTNNVKADNKELLPEVINSVARKATDMIFEKVKNIKSNLIFIGITGFPGTGKTVLAQNYSEKYWLNQTERKNKIRWFIRSDNKYLCREDYQALARKLGVTLGSEIAIESIISAVNKQLLSYPGFILIFDNVNDYQDVAQFVPNNPNLVGQIVLTSQNANIIPIEKRLSGISISLNDGMTESESIELVSRLAGYQELQEQEAKTLVNRLDKLPLALVQAASYMSKSKLNFSEYLALYEQQYQQLFMQEMLPSTYNEILSNDGSKKNHSKNTYENVLRFSINKLTPLAQEILFISSYLNPDHIPINLFETLMPHEKIYSVLEELSQHSLVIICNAKIHFSIHRVMQDMGKLLLHERSLIDNQEKRTIEKVLELIHAQHQKNIVTEHDYYGKKYLIPHLEQVLSQTQILAENNPFKLQGLLDCALLYKAIGNAKQAIYVYQQILPWLSNSEDAFSGEVYRGLGRAYQGVGEFENAKNAFEKTYNIYLKLNLNPSIQMAEILNDLGMINRDIGHESQKTKKSDQPYFVTAERYLNQAVAMISILPNQRKNEVRYLSNLGEIYRQLKDHTKAIEIIKSAIQLGETEFRDGKHRLMSSAYYNLGNIYMDMQEYSQAKTYLEKAVMISQDEKVAGKNHPLFARHLDSLGMVWKKLGEEKKACHYFKEAFDIIDSTKLGQNQLKMTIQEHISECE